MISPPRIILGLDVNAYTSTYIKVLEQLVERHRIFKTLIDIMGIHDVSLDEYETRTNKWDDEIKDFMLSTERKYRTYKGDQIE